MTDDLATLDLVGAAMVEAVEAIAGATWTAPTPCSGWNHVELVDHMTGGNRFTVHILNGMGGEDALAATLGSFGPDHRCGPAGIESMGSMVEAFGRPGALDRQCEHLIGWLRGAQVLRLRLHDLIVHTWDISGTVPPDLVDWGVAELARPDSIAVEHFRLERAQTYLGRFGRPG